MSVQPPVDGRLFTFGDDPARQMSVFMTGASKRAFVVVGGQGSSFFALHSMRMLIKELEALGWATAQTQTASSLVGYSGRTHVGDAEDLRDLIELLERDFAMSEITLFGWASGVQVVLEYLNTSDNAEVVTRVILQGVIGNPNDFLFSEEGSQRRAELVADWMASGRGENIVPIDVYDVPISAARLSTGGLPTLQEAVWQPAVKGDFESLRRHLQHIKVPLMLMVAMSTQYFPTEETKQQVRNAISAAAATPELEINYFEAAGDERRRMLRGSEAKHAATIAFFLKACDRRRSEREEAAKQQAAEDLRRSRSILAKSTLKLQ
jgi:pimeloyl-ACP methyl ester carboxylesterase